jgi:hypothetical protein
MVRAAGAIDEHLGLLAHHVERVLDVHVALAVVREQAEQRVALLIGFLHDRPDVPHVVLVGALLARVEAAAHSEDEQDEHEQTGSGGD